MNSIVFRRWLLYFGIIFLAFFEIIVTVLLPHKQMEFSDTRIPREVLSINIAFIIVLISIYKGQIGAFPNKFFLALIGFALITIPLSPPFAFYADDVLVKAYWFYKPLFKLLVFTLFIGALISMKIYLEFELIKKFFITVGLIMSAYVLLQSFGLDQFFGKMNNLNPDAPGTPMMYSGGTLGNPTIVSPFIAMIVPFCLFDKKYIHAVGMALCVFFTKSDVAILALISGLGFYFLSFNALAMKVYCSIILCCLGVFAIFLAINHPILRHIEGSGRFESWRKIIHDVNKPIKPLSQNTYEFSGKGIGSYRHTFVSRYETRFHQAHNSILQTLYSLGIVGAVLLVVSYITYFYESIKEIALNRTYLKELRVLTASSLIVILASLGTIIIHLGIFWFYFSVIASMTFGILNYNKNLGGFCDVE